MLKKGLSPGDGKGLSRFITFRDLKERGRRGGEHLLFPLSGREAAREKVLSRGKR